ncbi:MAG: molybdopterin molybdenumtransferase MoeA, partial [Gammaproteobacteria bacterium]|nr:molybdopterin molybdenumtransferase MoeA [Gammaproteobacteria bacterium]
MKSFDEALAYLLSKAVPTAKQETIQIQSALGRVLAEDITASLNVPPHNNSMMDGYALDSKTLASADKETLFTVSQRIAAGTVGTPLVKGTIARIFTGAPMPEGADTVVMQEETEQVGEG